MKMEGSDVSKTSCNNNASECPIKQEVEDYDTEPSNTCNYSDENNALPIELESDSGISNDQVLGKYEDENNVEIKKKSKNDDSSVKSIDAIKCEDNSNSSMCNHFSMNASETNKIKIEKDDSDNDEDYSSNTKIPTNDLNKTDGIKIKEEIIYIAEDNANFNDEEIVDMPSTSGIKQELVQTFDEDDDEDSTKNIGIKRKTCEESKVQNADKKRKPTSQKQTLIAYKYNCTFCSYGCSKSEDFIQHTNNHTGDHKYKCSLCDYKTSLKRSYRNHINNHTGEHKYKCKLCDYKTPNKTFFTNHMNNHSGDHTYKCTFCDYQTSLRYGFMDHMNTHTGEHKFKCDLCPYQSSKRQNYIQHINKHTGEHKYKCTYCDYQTSNKRSYTDHINTHTGEYRFQCTLCKFGSNRRDKLTQHMNKHCQEVLSVSVELN